MLRLCFKILVIISLLLGTLLAVVYVRSLYAIDVYTCPPWEAYSSNELRLFIDTSKTPLSIPSDQLGHHSFAHDDWSQRGPTNYLTWAVATDYLEFPGVEVRRAEKIHMTIVIINYRFFLGLFATPPLIAILLSLFHWVRRRRRRTTLGLCAQCSYDLRAHNPGNKCPECGTTIPTPISQTPS